MEYNLNVNDTIEHIEVDLKTDNQVEIQINETRYQVEFERISDNKIYLMINDGTSQRSLNAYLGGDKNDKEIVLDGLHFQVQDADALAQGQSKKSGGSDLPDTVTPPMPAVVIAILINVGDVVEKGKDIVVLSAMKMETTLKAPFGGTVTSINTKQGDKVAPGDILVEIEKEESE